MAGSTFSHKVDFLCRYKYTFKISAFNLQSKTNLKEVDIFELSVRLVHAFGNWWVSVRFTRLTSASEMLTQIKAIHLFPVARVL